jgi:mannose-6-phosphate isomerase-like protein (cupin superfamily)
LRGGAEGLDALDGGFARSLSCGRHNSEKERSMQRAMLSVLAVLFALSTTADQTPPNPTSATDVSAADIEATLKQEMANSNPVNDMPIRVVDAGGYNVGIGLVHRLKTEKGGGSASHDKVTEVFQILEGSGTLVTGGTLVDPQRRDSPASMARYMQLNGPGVSGTAVQGGVSRRIAKGDMVIIPAGTPHWWSEVREALTYTVVRVDPSRVITLK